MIWRLLRKLFDPVVCWHAWDYHVSALPRAGEPEAWKKCRICGRVEVERFSGN
ncbi:hypothetical protein MAL1_00235 [Bacteriophage DSS3_MAL1]|nr:hypothetical protein MAL1_00235 [Bacteriophage DSS3_MAL1]